MVDNKLNILSHFNSLETTRSCRIEYLIMQMMTWHFAMQIVIGMDVNKDWPTGSKRTGTMVKARDLHKFQPEPEWYATVKP